jgi:hypothetical protein
LFMVLVVFGIVALLIFGYLLRKNQGLTRDLAQAQIDLLALQARHFERYVKDSNGVIRLALSMDCKHWSFVAQLQEGSAIRYIIEDPVPEEILDLMQEQASLYTTLLCNADILRSSAGHYGSLPYSVGNSPEALLDADANLQSMRHVLASPLATVSSGA